MKYLDWGDGELTNQEIAQEIARKIAQEVGWEIAQEMVEETKIFKNESDWWKCSI